MMSPTRLRRRDFSGLRLRLMGHGLAVTLVCAASGCVEMGNWDAFGSSRRSGGDAEALRPVVDRLRDTYPELSTNRFVVLADFEDPIQSSMFTMRTAGHRGYFHPSIRVSRPETGAGSLEVYFSDPDDVLMALSVPGADWSFPGDWRAYRLLLMSIHSAHEQAAVGLEIAARGPGQVFRRDRIPLKKGWNTIRVDLSDVAGTVDLSDVVRIAWRVQGPERSASFYLDDLILTDNRRVVWGELEGPAGELYVIHEGQRIRAGSHGRFELVFYNGEIAEWYDLGADPKRERNCANWPRKEPAAIGPMAVLLRSASSDEEPDEIPEQSARGETSVDLDGMRGWSQTFRMIQVRQRVVETSVLRAVVECERVLRSGGALFGEGVDDPSSEGNEVRITTRYTITPQGRVFVGVTCPTEGQGWRAREVGLAFASSWGSGFQTRCHSAPIRLPGENGPGESYILFWRGQGLPGTSDLLCTAHNSSALPDAVRLIGGGTDRVGAMFRTSRLQYPVQKWGLMLAFWPDDLDDLEAAGLIAASYCRPPALETSVGRTVRTEEGDLDNDGYNESQGCYVVEPENGRARMRLDVRDFPFWYPTIKLAGTKGMSVWAYADGRILPSDARTADGSVLLGLGGVVDRPVEIEVTVRQEGGAPGG